MVPLYLAIIAVVAYGIGGINGSIIASKNFFKKDVRDYGSKNAGLTNFYRTFGPFGIALVLATDVLKALIGVFFGAWLMGTLGHPMVGKLFAGFCLILGHMYPAYYQLRGGKGVLCGAIVMLAADWRVGIMCLLVFFLVVVFTRYVSLGSVAGSLCAPLGFLIFGQVGLHIWLAVFCCLAIVIKHNGNLLRIVSGTESQLNFGRRNKPTL